MKQELILIRGLPGSGKTTLARNILAYEVSGLFHVEADDFFYFDEKTYNYDGAWIKEAHDYCYSRCAYWLFRGVGGIVSNTFTKAFELEKYIRLAKRMDMPVKIITCMNDFGSLHDVPDETLKRMKDRFVPSNELNFLRDYDKITLEDYYAE